MFCTFHFAILHTRMTETFLLFTTRWQSTANINLHLCIWKYVIAVWAFDCNCCQPKSIFLKNMYLITSWLVCSTVPSTLLSPKAILSPVSVALLHLKHKRRAQNTLVLLLLLHLCWVDIYCYYEKCAALFQSTRHVVWIK